MASSSSNENRDSDPSLTKEASLATPHDNDDDDPWSAQANLCTSQASRLTELHGADLITLLRRDILWRARTILDLPRPTCNSFPVVCRDKP